MGIFVLKLKRFLFLSLGILVIAGIIFGASLIGINTKSDYVILKIVISLGLVIALSLVTFLIEMMFGDNFRSFLLASLSIFFDQHNKLVYHDDLGYFFTSFRDEKVTVYRQGIFYIKELFTVFNDGNPDYVSKCIKKKLDEMYSDKVKNERYKKDISDKINNLKKWDGYLDKRGRRDGKLNEILK